jgi:predicted nucleic acid-binding protein
MHGYILDASAALAWLFSEEPDGRLIGYLIRGHGAVAPWLWRVEVVNAVVRKERRGELRDQSVSEILNEIDRLSIELVGPRRQARPSDLAALAKKTGLTAYDAEYLQLALETGLPLMSLDQKLQRAAVESGVELVKL